MEIPTDETDPVRRPIQPAIVPNSKKNTTKIGSDKNRKNNRSGFSDMASSNDPKSNNRTKRLRAGPPCPASSKRVSASM